MHALVILRVLQYERFELAKNYAIIPKKESDGNPHFPPMGEVMQSLVKILSLGTSGIAVENYSMVYMVVALQCGSRGGAMS